MATIADVSMIMPAGHLAIEQLTVVGGPVRLGQPGCAIATDGEEAIGQERDIFSAEALEPLAKGLLDDRCQGFTGDVGDLRASSCASGLLMFRLMVEFYHVIADSNQSERHEAWASDGGHPSSRTRPLPGP